MARQTGHALRCGALQPIATRQEIVEDGGVRFLVRVVSSLARKDEDRARRAAAPKPANPFLPPDPDLFVADVTPSHFALLNKFNVIDRHLLIVTREFEDQEFLLNPEDFEALWACMAEFEGLGFYNGGMAAGASQPHKHLQMVPLPLGEAGPAVPIEPLLAAAQFRGALGRVPGLPFAHAFARLDPALADPARAARVTHALYREMLDAVRLKPVDADGGLRQSGPYNLLATRDWMLLVPRSAERFDSISVNALGFAGSLFVRSEQQLAAVRDCGPMKVLASVAVTAPPR